MVAQGEVKDGDTVRTADGSRVEITLGPADFVRLNENSTVAVAIKTAAAPARQIQVRVEGGDVWSDMEAMGKGDDFEVETPTAGASIRGTRFNTSVGNEGATSIAVHQGEVQVYDPQYKKKPQPDKKSPRKEVTGPQEVAGPKEIAFEQWVEIVKAGQKISIAPGGQHSVADIGATENEKDREWRRFNEERREAHQKEK